MNARIRHAVLVKPNSMAVEKLAANRKQSSRNHHFEPIFQSLSALVQNHADVNEYYVPSLTFKPNAQAIEDS